MKPETPKVWAHVVCVQGVHYATCASGLSQAWVRTASGRTIQFPKLGIDTGNRRMWETRFRRWLMGQAILEATAAHDDYAATLFAGKDAKHLSPSDMDDLNDYLFDPKLPRTANGLLTITAPLSAT